jgi:hypothetical protein
VGGTAIPADKIGLLAPWIVLVVLIATILMIVILSRRKAKS